MSLATPSPIGTLEFRSAHLLAPLLLLLVSGAVFFVPLFAGNEDVPGDLGDARFNMYILEHVYRWLAGHEASLLSPPMFFPFPYTLAFSDTHAGSAAVYALFRSVGFDEYDAYKGWFAVGYVASYLAAYIVLIRLSVSPFLAAVAAFAFAFSLPAVAKIGHAQLAYRVAVPFCFYFILRYGEDKQPNDLLKFLTALAIQFLFNVYLGLFALVLSALLLLMCLCVSAGLRPTHWWLEIRERARNLLRFGTYDRRIVALAFCALVLCGALLGFHRFVASLYGYGRPWWEIHSMIPQIQSYFIMDGLPYWAPVSSSLPDVAARNEHQIFLGIPVVILLAVAVATICWKRFAVSPRLKIFVLSVLATKLVITAVGPYSLYWFLAQFPGFEAARAVARYQLVAAFPITVVIALFVEEHASGWNRSFAKPVLAVGLAAWMAFDIAVMHKSSFSSDRSRQQVEQIVTRAAQVDDKSGQVLVYGGDPKLVWYMNQIDAMLATAKLGIPTLNGYSGHGPPGYNIFPSCQSFQRQLAYYAKWAEPRGFPSLSAIAYEPLAMLISDCNLDRQWLVSNLTDGPGLSRSDGKMIRLSDARFERKGDDQIVTVELSNASTATAHALSDSLLRLSWRRVHAGQDVRQNWKNRIEIGADLKADSSRRVSFSIRGPHLAAGQAIEVTFVVERRYWAHDIGVLPVRIAVP